MSKMKSPTDFNNILEVAIYFNSEEKCLKYLEQWLHNDDITCAYCGFNKPYRYSDGKSFRCSNCQSLFTLKVGTIFEDSKLPLMKWFMAMYLLANNKKGISSYQLARHIGVTQKTAWYISHKIRKTFKQEDEKLTGEIQIDETFVGGKNKGRHIHKKVKNSHDRTFKDKVTVIGFLSDDKKLKTEKITNVMNHNLQPAVRKHVEADSTLVTDEWQGYIGLDGEYNHSSVNHSARRFLNEQGKTSNGIENVWSHLKRMFIGTYNFVRRWHMQKYLDEYTFRYNTQKMLQGIRFAMTVSNCRGRVTYKQIIYESQRNDQR